MDTNARRHNSACFGHTNRALQVLARRHSLTLLALYGVNRNHSSCLKPRAHLASPQPVTSLAILTAGVDKVASKIAVPFQLDLHLYGVSRSSRPRAPATPRTLSPPPAFSDAHAAVTTCCTCMLPSVAASSAAPPRSSLNERCLQKKSSRLHRLHSKVSTHRVIMVKPLSSRAFTSGSRLSLAARCWRPLLFLAAPWHRVELAPRASVIPQLIDSPTFSHFVSHALLARRPISPFHVVKKYFLNLYSLYYILPTCSYMVELEMKIFLRPLLENEIPSKLTSL
ncbi:hypothetical protein K438DRAFT_2002322 [Mycena galopus ATCC 62051]|nr:hypothetical protein K438DRAFT_2002322 [Mycena galopus ATCC 62051]